MINLHREKLTGLMQEGRGIFWFVFIFLSIPHKPAPTIDATVICSLFPDFTPEQKNLCVRNPQVVSAISSGVGTALTECEYQFQNDRWNCSSTNDKSSFGQTRAVPGTKEAAFTSAIVAAGVAHAVTRECAKGNISSCSCDKTNEGKTSPGGFKWGGCSHDIDYGIGISDKFLGGPARGLINKKVELLNRHNSDAGRQVIRNSFKTDCRCHGASGSCASKTCWKSLSKLRNVGNILKQKYKSAVLVDARMVNSRIGKIPKTLVYFGYETLKVSPDELVYLKVSPDYCEPNPKKGIPGTSGRRCDHSSNEMDGCQFLCCGRGYNRMEFTEDVNCNCRFYWCCRVNCKTCRRKSEKIICK